MVVLLIVAGHETTVSLIGERRARAAPRKPEVLAALRAEPAVDPVRPSRSSSAARQSVDRTLNRWAAADVELGGQTIKARRARDRDPGLRRPRPPPASRSPTPSTSKRADNKHVAFGRGSHYCLGAPLARLETEIALATLLRRLPGLRLVGDPDDVELAPRAALPEPRRAPGGLGLGPLARPAPPRHSTRAVRLGKAPSRSTSRSCSRSSPGSRSRRSAGSPTSC